MAIVKTDRMPLEDIRKMLEAGFKLDLISQQTGYPLSALSIMAHAWGIKLKRGRPRKRAK